MTVGEAKKILKGIEMVGGSLPEDGDLVEETLLMAIEALEQQPINPEKGREESEDYCAECDHIEMCSWYPTDGCVWLKTDRFNAGYNTAKREIALSGEYERAYRRGFQKALEQQPCEDYNWKALWEQVKWERDIAIEQLDELGYGLGEKIRTSEDCISREAVVNTIHKTVYGFFDIADDDSEEPINDKDKLLLSVNKAVCNAIKDLPSVTPKQKVGKWIDVEGLEGALWHDCSECGETEFYATDYCPNCGAKMEVEE